MRETCPIYYFRILGKTTNDSKYTWKYLKFPEDLIGNEFYLSNEFNNEGSFSIRSSKKDYYDNYIYEGDVVNDYQGRVYLVGFDLHKIYLVDIEINKRNSLSIAYKIIGNIYENTDILETILKNNILTTKKVYANFLFPNTTL